MTQKWVSAQHKFPPCNILAVPVLPIISLLLLAYRFIFTFSFCFVTMPCLNVSTNSSVDGVDISPILSELSKKVAQIIGKPEAYVMVLLRGSVPLSFGGTEDPAAYGELVSIGGLGPGTNKKLSAAISDVLSSKLNVAKSRVYIKFYDVQGSYFGWNGSTF